MNWCMTSLLVMGVVVVSMNFFIVISVDFHDAVVATSLGDISMASSWDASLRSRSTRAISHPLEGPPPGGLHKLEDSQMPTQPCLISCYSSDGIGHQMEAKLSCIATAAALNMTYVHMPMDRAEHGTDSSKMETYFGISHAIPALSHAILFDNSTMKRVTRRPLPFIGRCDQKSWFDESIRNGACQKRQTDGGLRPVFTADNCWDFFWCQLGREPETMGRRWRNGISPILRESFLQAGKTALELAPANDHMFAADALSVVLHVRRGDAVRSRSVGGSFYTNILDKLRRATANDGGMRIVIHSDGTREEVISYLNMTEPLERDLSIVGQDSDTSMDSVIYQMVVADVFVASKSSLSHTVGLLRKGPVIHPETNERPGMVSIGWHMMKPMADSPTELETYELEDLQTNSDQDGISIDERARWVRTADSFWTDLVREGKSKRTLPSLTSTVK